MTNESKKFRLESLNMRWTSEPLGIDFPSLGVEIGVPKTPIEYVLSPRIIAGEEAANVEHFGVSDPKAVFAALNSLFEQASTNTVDPQIIKQAAVALQVLKKDSQNLIAHFGESGSQPDAALAASYAADLKATEKCLDLVQSLAAELGISVPTRSDHSPG